MNDPMCKSASGNDTKIILVTGGAGFIGSNFIRYILSHYQDCKVINFDKLTYAGNLYNLAEANKNPHYVFVKGDVFVSRDVKNVFEQFNPDYVVHFAAESHVDRSIINPDVFLQTNIMGTQNVLKFAREYQIKKFVQISTDEVYGSIEAGKQASEEDGMNPNNPYAASKAAADLLTRVAHQTYGLNVNIVRSCNNFGPHQFPEKLIPLLLNNLQEDNDLPIYGQGKNIREWMFVEDNCCAIDLVLNHGKSGEIYNVGSGNCWENIEIATFLLAQFPQTKANIKFVTDRPGHDFRYSMNSDKIRRELGWQPQSDLKSGLLQTINWYQNQLDWIEKIRSGEYMKYYDQNYSHRMTETV
ncbi:MAG TPA: dTDP-glucose 4,6-dehydratase [Candidatus Cloacimonadota bacterium]|nr:dTDP-glucose 4,6-dehydratase [Candidatus Cloacimonadota bacterium]